jgi:hypothetical protein
VTQRKRLVAIVDKGGSIPSADSDNADIAALKALNAGVANEQQQKRALGWFLKQAARVDQVSYVPGDRDATMFNEGRRFAGLATIQLLQANPINEGK